MLHQQLIKEVCVRTVLLITPPDVTDELPSEAVTCRHLFVVQFTLSAVALTMPDDVEHHHIGIVIALADGFPDLM